MSQNLLHVYNAPLVSEEVNERFGDILGGSIIAGFRVVQGTSSHKASLVKGADATNIMITWTGVRIEETQDVADVVTVAVNSTTVDRMDSIYAVYVHGEPVMSAEYVVIQGDAAGNPAPMAGKQTHTLIGFVNVPANDGALTAVNFVPRARGLATLTVSEQALFNGDVIVHGKLTTENLPQQDYDVVNKLYLDAVVAGLTIKKPVRVVTTVTDGNLILGGIQSVDGVALIDGDRVLVTQQTGAAENGIYVVHGGSWVRAADADSTNAGSVSEVKSGIFCFVTEGTKYKNSGWTLVTPDPIVLGTTALEFVQFSAAGQSIAGEGLQKNGNEISLVPATAATLGGVKQGVGITIDPNGVIAIRYLVAGGDNGDAAEAARSNHLHDARYPTKTGLAATGGPTIHMDNVTGLQAKFSSIDGQLDEVKNYNVYASSQDPNTFVYVVSDYKRADGTLYMKSTLSNPNTDGNYQTLTLQLYDAAGTAVTSTKVWTLAYDIRGNVISKVLS